MLNETAPYPDIPISRRRMAPSRMCARFGEAEGTSRSYVNKQIWIEPLSKTRSPDFQQETINFSLQPKCVALLETSKLDGSCVFGNIYT